MANSDYLKRVMAMSGATQRPEEFIQSVNQVYHEIGASGYDLSHNYIWADGSTLWREMLGAAGSFSAMSGVDVLDFGSGTGFAVLQVARWLPPGRIKRVVLIEPSLEMAKIAMRRLSKLGVNAVHYPALEDVDRGGSFGIVCENSVLHHLPDPASTVRNLAERVGSDGILILAQEPNLLFHSGPIWWINKGARSLLKLGRRRRGPGAKASMMNRVGRELLVQGIVKNPIPDEDIGLIVDYWVPRPWHAQRRREALGFSPRALHQLVGSGFSVAFHRSYDHLGKPRSQLPALLRPVDTALRVLSPSKGQHFAVAFQRSSQASGPNRQSDSTWSNT